MNRSETGVPPTGSSWTGV